MFKLFLLSFLLGTLISNGSVIAGNVIDMEWNLLGDLIVTYQKNNGDNSKIDCIAYNQEGVPVGSGYYFTKNGFARIRVDVRLQYIGENLDVHCK